MASAGTAATDELRETMVENGAEVILLNDESDPRTLG